MSLTTAVKARVAAVRNRDNDEAGFTLIELLVVVIIIGILAAIAIPVYIGVQNNAKDAAVKSDLGNAKTAVVAYTTANPSATVATATLTTTTLGSYGFTSGTDTSAWSYVASTANTGAFCIQAKSTSTNNTWSILSTGGVTSGACPAAGSF